MNRMQFETWLVSHPESILMDPRHLLDRCELEIGEHAHEVAWKHASGVASGCLQRFERTFGLPASENFVAKEVCGEVVRALRHHGPHVEQVSEDEWLSRAILDSMTAEARSQLHDWLAELAEQEEQAAWQEIIYFTKHMARSLIAHTRMSNALEWDLERSYPKLARRVIERLIHEFDQHGRDAANHAPSWDTP